MYSQISISLLAWGLTQISEWQRPAQIVQGIATDIFPFDKEQEKYLVFLLISQGK